MADTHLHLPLGSCSDGVDPIVVTPESAGWDYCGLRVAHLAGGDARQVATDDCELAVVPLVGSVTLEVNGQTIELKGRDSVFARISDWAYIPIGAELTLQSAQGAEIALATARAERRHEVVYIPSHAVPWEIRGAGAATRQIVNFMAPSAFDGADRLMCVEVMTPDGNWSSYPPHKHDDSPDSLAENEEIYYFRLGKTGSTGTSDEGFAFHRTYTSDGSIDTTVVVRDEDVFLVPRGYHGPTVAAPGYPLYYLNVMAGPNATRTMAIVDDSAHAWIRGSWTSQVWDPRCPLIVADPPGAQASSLQL